MKLRILIILAFYSGFESVFKNIVPQDCFQCFKGVWSRPIYVYLKNKGLANKLHLQKKKTLHKSINNRWKGMTPTGKVGGFLCTFQSHEASLLRFQITGNTCLGHREQVHMDINCIFTQQSWHTILLKDAFFYSA